MQKKSRKEEIRSNIFKYYLFEAFLGACFFVPIIVLFWQENGLSLLDVMILQSIFSIIVIALEIPTGYFADNFGRKKSIVWASFFIVIAMAIYSIGDSFGEFLVAEVVWAIGVSLISGADSAFVYDTLKELKEEHNYKKVWGNTLFIALISLTIASIIGGIVGSINFRYALYLTTLFLLPTIFIALSLKEPRRKKKIIEKGYGKELLKIIRWLIIENKKTRWIIMYSGVIVGLGQAILWLYQPYFKLSGIQIAYYGAIFASLQLVAAISSKYAHVIENKIGMRLSIIMPLILLGLSYLLMSKLLFLFSFAFAYLQQFVRGFSDVVIADYLNKLTKSDIRATVLSAQSLVSRLLYAAIIPFLGFIADKYSLLQALTITGITIFIGGGITIFFLYKDKVL